MELTTLRPYNYKTMSQVFNHLIHDMMIYLPRIVFTEYSYLNRCIDFNLFSPQMRRLMFQTIYFWSIIGSMLLLLLSPSLISLRTIFDKIFQHILSIQNTDLLCLTYLFCELNCEAVFIYSINILYHYSDGRICVLFELNHRLDYELNPIIRSKFLCFFNLITYISGICLKCFVLLLSLFTGSLVIAVVHQFIINNYNNYNIHHLLFVIGIIVSIQYYLYYIIFAMIVSFTGLFLVIRIFRYNLAQARALLVLGLCNIQRGIITKQQQQQHHLISLLSSSSSFMVLDMINDKFYPHYINTHRLVHQYNQTLRNYMEMLEFGTKFLTTFGIIYIAKQKEPSLLAYLLTLPFVITYIFYIYIINILSHLPSQNAGLYKSLAKVVCNVVTIRSTSRHLYKLKQIFNYSNNNNNNNRAIVTTITKKKLTSRQLVKIDMIVHVLSNNRLGLSMGQRYVITKYSNIQSLGAYCYMLTLLYKKLQI